jgi:hypothetical protein
MFTLITFVGQKHKRPLLIACLTVYMDFVLLPCVSGYTPLTNLHSLILTLIPIIMLKNIIIILSVILNLVFIPAVSVDYTTRRRRKSIQYSFSME